jgi:hypothetical protein
MDRRDLGGPRSQRGVRKISLEVFFRTDVIDRHSLLCCRNSISIPHLAQPGKARCCLARCRAAAEKDDQSLLTTQPSERPNGTPVGGVGSVSRRAQTVSDGHDSRAGHFQFRRYPFVRGAVKVIRSGWSALSHGGRASRTTLADASVRSRHHFWASSTLMMRRVPSFIARGASPACFSS